MQFNIILNDDLNPRIKKQFAEYLYNKINIDLYNQVNRFYKKYQVREKYVLNSTLIKWKGEVPTHIDLSYYIKNCLILTYVHGTYIIKVNDQWVIKGTFTPVKLLIRMLEYGTEIVPPFPLVRKLLNWYSNNYLNLFAEFVTERIDIIL